MAAGLQLCPWDEFESAELNSTHRCFVTEALDPGIAALENENEKKLYPLPVEVAQKTNI
jgi:hypothetical protein